MGGLTWPDPSATTSGSTVRDLWEPVLDRHRFAFSGWIAHSECAVENTQGGSDRGDDRLGVAVGRGDGPPRRRTFRLTEIVSRVYQRYDGATEWGVHRWGQLVRSWQSVISEGEEVANLNENQ